MAEMDNYMVMGSYAPDGGGDTSFYEPIFEPKSRPSTTNKVATAHPTNGRKPEPAPKPRNLPPRPAPRGPRPLPPTPRTHETNPFLPTSRSRSPEMTPDVPSRRTPLPHHPQPPLPPLPTDYQPSLPLPPPPPIRTLPPLPVDDEPPPPPPPLELDMESTYAPMERSSRFPSPDTKRSSNTSDQYISLRKDAVLQPVSSSPGLGTIDSPVDKDAPMTDLRTQNNGQSQKQQQQVVGFGPMRCPQITGQCICPERLHNFQWFQELEREDATKVRIY